MKLTRKGKIVLAILIGLVILATWAMSHSAESACERSGYGPSRACERETQGNEEFDCREVGAFCR